MEREADDNNLNFVNLVKRTPSTLANESQTVWSPRHRDSALKNISKDFGNLGMAIACTLYSSCRVH